MAKILSSPAQASFVQAWALLFSFGMAATLFVMSAHAQSPDVPAPAASSAASSADTPAPRYAAADLERAFGFMDSNRDGKVSREEASGFRGVAKNFDRADTNQDGFLSREEFGAAMNYVKSKSSQ
ncbi:MAG: putative signal transduction protein with EFhand domain [Polaromonas sp.]|nr:putative signal transduction protein with EFhand domain [Polaromonas sp.]